jgi:hypothetical protein
MGKTELNLKAAVAGETYERIQMYPGMVKTARDEGFAELSEWFETLAKAGKSHAGRFNKGPTQIKGTEPAEALQREPAGRRSPVPGEGTGQAARAEMPRMGSEDLQRWHKNAGLSGGRVPGAPQGRRAVANNQNSLTAGPRRGPQPLRLSHLFIVPTRKPERPPKVATGLHSRTRSINAAKNGEKHGRN